MFLLIPSAISLGVSPGIKTISFLSGQQVNITINILDSSPDKLYDIGFRGGDFVKYSKLSSSVVSGESSVLLIIDFPLELPEPGKHSISVSVKERPSEESFLGTVIEVGSLIEFFVPYPGVYPEISLNIPDSNSGDEVPVELHVINRGLYELSISSAKIDFFTSSDEFITYLNFTPVSIAYAGDRYFRKFLNSSALTPGNYIAVATIQYDNLDKSVNSTFKLGNLFVNVTNYTRELSSGDVYKFIIDLESNWNIPLSNVFADVYFLNGTGDPFYFRTLSTDILPWQKTSVENYIDTTNLLGNYNISINLSYPGNSSLFYGNIDIVDSPVTFSALVISLIVVGLIILIILVWLFFKYYKK